MPTTCGTAYNLVNGYGHSSHTTPSGHSHTSNADHSGHGGSCHDHTVSSVCGASYLLANGNSHTSHTNPDGHSHSPTLHYPTLYACHEHTSVTTVCGSTYLVANGNSHNTVSIEFDANNHRHTSTTDHSGHAGLCHDHVVSTTCGATYLLRDDANHTSHTNDPGHHHTSTTDHSGHNGDCHEHPVPWTQCGVSFYLIDPNPGNDHTTSQHTCPVVDVTGGGGVAEGDPGDPLVYAEFTFTVTNDVGWLPVDVSYTVSQTGDYVAAADLGTKTVTIPAGTAPVEVVVRVPIVHDNQSEPDGTVTVTVNTGTGYTPGTSADVNVTDDEPSTPNPGTGTCTTFDWTVSWTGGPPSPAVVVERKDTTSLTLADGANDPDNLGETYTLDLAAKTLTVVRTSWHWYNSNVENTGNTAADRATGAPLRVTVDGVVVTADLSTTLQTDCGIWFPG